MKILWYNHLAQIVDADEYELNIAKRKLTIWYKTYQGELRSYRLLYKNSFPSAYMPFFLKKVKKANISVEVEDKRVLPRTFESPLRYTKLFENREHQNKALDAASQHPVGLISIPTGGGKSEVIKDIVYQKNTNTLIIAPRVLIKEQLLQDFKSSFGSSVVSGDVPAANGHKKIHIITYHNLDKLPRQYLESIGLVIVDEAHHTAADSIRLALIKMPSAYYRYGLSATPWRDKYVERVLLQSALGEVIYDYSFQEGVADGVVVGFELRVIPSEAPRKFMKYVKNARNIMDYGIIRNDNRNRLICDIAEDNLSNNRRIFIAIDEEAQYYGKDEDDDKSYALKHILDGRGIKHFYISSSVGDKLEIIKQLNSTPDGEGFIVIGTMSLGEGVNIPSIDTVILASWGKSSINLLQRIGRASRVFGQKEKFVVYDFNDFFNPALKRHFLQRLSILKRISGQ